jgi:NADH-quinone oxidoreductase subunit M
MLMRVFFGPVKEPAHEGHGPVHDLNLRELAALVPIAVVCVLLGVYPQPVLNSSAHDIGVVADITQQARTRAQQAAQRNTAGPSQQAALDPQRGEPTR